VITGDGDGPAWPYGLGSVVWVANEYGKTLTLVDPATGQTLSTVDVPGVGPDVVRDAGGGRMAVLMLGDGEAGVSLLQPAPATPSALTVTIDGAGPALSGPAPSPELVQAVQTAVTESTGAPAVDGTGGLTGGPVGVVRIVGDGTLATGDRALQLQALAARLEATGLYVDREFEAVQPPSAVAIESMLNALFADSSVFFASGSAELTEESQSTLSLAASILESVPFTAVEIEGHTDSDGDDASNQALSEARAQAVRQYLVDYSGGDYADQLTAVGYGESRPIADNATPEGKARNRRIQFRVTGLAGGP